MKQVQVATKAVHEDRKQVANPGSEEKVVVSKKERRQLFEMLDAAEKAVSTHSKAASAAIAKRDAILSEIALKCGKGPFEWRGQQLSIAVRVKSGHVFARRFTTTKVEKVD